MATSDESTYLEIATRTQNNATLRSKTHYVFSDSAVVPAGRGPVMRPWDSHDETMGRPGHMAFIVYAYAVRERTAVRAHSPPYEPADHRRELMYRRTGIM